MPTYRLRGVPVEFPYEAYDCQLVYMEHVIDALQTGRNALLESPTGTGKTLCLLCATLAWRESLQPGPATQVAEPRPEVGNFLAHTKESAEAQGVIGDWNHLKKPSAPTILYSSRTHSQLQQVVRELKATQYRVRSTVLGSREQLCIHPEISALRGVAQNQACKATTGAKACRHYNQLRDFLPSRPDVGEQPLDIEDLLKLGKEEGPCPYFLSRELVRPAEVIFVPYNYLVDVTHRSTLAGIEWDNTVLIFDEAHNLESICADVASFDLPAVHLAQCIGEAKQCIELALARAAGGAAGGEGTATAESFSVLKALLLELERRINALPLQQSNGFTKAGAWILEFLGELNINFETANMLLDTIDQATSLLTDEAAAAGSRSGSKQSHYRLSALAGHLKKIFQPRHGATPNSYRVHIHEDQGFKKGGNRGGGEKGAAVVPRTLSYWCLDPGVAFQEFSSLGVKTVVVTSGTLAPLESFAHELRLPFQVRLENPHVIKASQMWAGVVPVGPSGRSLNSSFRTRDSPEYKSELGNAIVNFARIVPDGLLVFFPSYWLLTTCVDFWQNPRDGNTSTIWERICRHKQPVIEPRESALFPQAQEDFAAKLDSTASSGAVFFAVCRGKVSEGLDFADRAGRAVIVTGMPFPMKTDPKVRLKREYLDDLARGKKGGDTAPLTGEKWYVQQAARAVNQAVGRVIRHRNDFGAIILADERFAQGGAQGQMSLWLRPHIRCFSKFGDAALGLTKFFRHQQATPAAKKPPRGADTAAFAAVKSPAVSASPRRPHIEVGFDAEALVGQQGGREQGGANVGGNFLSLLGRSGWSSAGESDGVCKESVSAVLAANRLKACEFGEGPSKKLRLAEAAVTAANCAVGSAPGTVSEQPMTGGQRPSADKAGSLKARLEAARRKQGEAAAAGQNNVPSLGKSRDSKRPVEPCSLEGHSKEEGAELGSRAVCTDRQATSGDSKATTSGREGGLEERGVGKGEPGPGASKAEKAAAFLQAVKAALSSEELILFRSQMRSMKEGRTGVAQLLDMLLPLFSARDRWPLLRAFGDVLGPSHREPFNECLKRVLSGEMSAGQVEG